MFREPKGEASSIIFDFSYLKTPDILETQIARDSFFIFLFLKISYYRNRSIRVEYGAFIKHNKIY